MAVLFVKVHAELNEFVDARGAFRTQGRDRVRPAQPCAGGLGVADVRGHRVVVGCDRRNPTLRIVRIALAQVGFGDENHLVLLGGLESRHETRNSGADNGNAFLARRIHGGGLGRLRGEHALESDPRKLGSLVVHGDAVHNLSGHQSLEHPRQVTGVDAVHR